MLFLVNFMMALLLNHDGGGAVDWLFSNELAQSSQSTTYKGTTECHYDLSIGELFVKGGAYLSHDAVR